MNSTHLSIKILSFSRKRDFNEKRLKNKKIRKSESWERLQNESKVCSRSIIDAKSFFTNKDRRAKIIWSENKPSIPILE